MYNFTVHHVGADNWFGDKVQVYFNDSKIVTCAPKASTYAISGQTLKGPYNNIILWNDDFMIIPCK